MAGLSSDGAGCGVPARLGSPPPEPSLTRRLHKAVLADRVRQVRATLQCGARVHDPNTLRQTPLFVAAMLGRRACAEILLAQGADPNRRCGDAGYTAVHAACYWGSGRLLRLLLTHGGDLRLCDLSGRRPADWARLQPDPARRIKILKLIEAARFAAIVSGYEYQQPDLVNRTSSSTSGGATGSGAARLRNFLRTLFPTAAAAASRHPLSDSFALAPAQSASTGGPLPCGFGAAGCCYTALPVAADGALEPDTTVGKRGAGPFASFRLGAFTEMAARVYQNTPVSVRYMLSPPPPPSSSTSSDADAAVGPPDLLIDELQAARQLRHPSLLLLMAVAPTDNRNSVALIFERVHMGSLYHCLHKRSMTFTNKQLADILLQVCSALQYLHAGNWLHCAVTSHAVQLMSPSRAKLGCLEYAVCTAAACDQPPPGRHTRLLAATARNAIYNWMAPELMERGVPDRRCDIYSLCVVAWEMSHNNIPWSGLTAPQIREQLLRAERQLQVWPDLCPPYVRELLSVGLRLNADERDLQLEEVDFMLNALRRSNAPRQSEAPPSVQRRHSQHPRCRHRVRLRDNDAHSVAAAVQNSSVQRSGGFSDPATDPYTGLRRVDPADPYTGLRRMDPVVRRSATFTAAAPSDDERHRRSHWGPAAAAIKPASHQLTRHGSSCSLGGIRRAATPRPLPLLDVTAALPEDTFYSAACSPGTTTAALARSRLNQQTSLRRPRFSPPSPPPSGSFRQLMTELDGYQLLAQHPGPMVLPPGRRRFSADCTASRQAGADTPASARLLSRSMSEQKPRSSMKRPAPLPPAVTSEVSVAGPQCPPGKSVQPASPPAVVSFCSRTLPAPSTPSIGGHQNKPEVKSTTAPAFTRPTVATLDTVDAGQQQSQLSTSSATDGPAVRRGGFAAKLAYFQAAADSSQQSSSSGAAGADGGETTGQNVSTSTTAALNGSQDTEHSGSQPSGAGGAGCVVAESGPAVTGSGPVLGMVGFRFPPPSVLLKSDAGVLDGTPYRGIQRGDVVASTPNLPQQSAPSSLEAPIALNSPAARSSSAAAERASSPELRGVAAAALSMATDAGEDRFVTCPCDLEEASSSAEHGDACGSSGGFSCTDDGADVEGDDEQEALDSADTSSTSQQTDGGCSDSDSCSAHGVMSEPDGSPQVAEGQFYDDDLSSPDSAPNLQLIDTNGNAVSDDDDKSAETISDNDDDDQQHVGRSSPYLDDGSRDSPLSVELPNEYDEQMCCETTRLSAAGGRLVHTPAWGTEQVSSQSEDSGSEGSVDGDAESGGSDALVKRYQVLCGRGQTATFRTETEPNGLITVTATQLLADGSVSCSRDTVNGGRVKTEIVLARD